jgi:hypothetical protein
VGSMIGVIHCISVLDEAIRANVFGAIPVGRFFSCWRRVAHLSFHFENIMSSLHLSLLMTWLRAELGLSPGSGGGQRNGRSTETSSWSPCPRVTLTC